MPSFEVSPDSRSVLLPIDPPDILPRVQRQMVQGQYDVKDEFHITVIGSDYGQRLEPDEFAALTEFFDTCNRDITDVLQPGRRMEFSVLDALYEVDKPKVTADGHHYPRHSLVALVSSIAIVRTVNDARYATDLPDIPQPFLHLTVATKPKSSPIAKRGIGIDSEQEWKSLSVTLYETEWLAAKGRKR